MQNVTPASTPGTSFRCGLGAPAGSFANRDAAVEFFRQIGDRIASVPGVTVRGAVSSLPFTSSVGWGFDQRRRVHAAAGQELQVDQRAATPSTSGRWRFRW